MGCGSSKPGAVLEDDHHHHHHATSNSTTGGAASSGGGGGGGLGAVYRKKKTVTYSSTAKDPATAGSSNRTLPKTRDRMDSWAHLPTSSSASGTPTSTTVPKSASSTTTATATILASGTGAASAIATTTTTTSTTTKKPTTSSRTSSTSSGSQKMMNSTSSWKGTSSSATAAPPPASSSSSKPSRQVIVSRKQLIETQWRYLWETHSLKIVDPADVHAVMDGLKSKSVNRLSAVEITFLQRKVRSVVKTLSDQIGNGSSGGDNNHRRNSSRDGGGGGGPSSAAIAAKAKSDAIRAVSLAEKHHVLNETVLSKLLPECILPNAYTILVHLSPTLWGRVSELAAFASSKAKLEMDVNKQTSDRWRMPKPSIVPEIEQPPDLPPGSTLNSLCCITAIALRGTRNQKLQLLFYLAVDHLNDFLSIHMAGGVPTFLLEVGCDTVLSLPSLTHYHYYGTAFLPQSSAVKQVPDFCASSSRPAVTLNIKRLKQILQFCCTMESATTTPTDNDSDTTAAQAAAATAASTPTRRTSRSRSYNVADKALDGNSSTTSSPGKRRARSLSNPHGIVFDTSNSDVVFPLTAVMQRLSQQPSQRRWDSGETSMIQSALDQLPIGSTVDESLNSMTLQSYAGWASSGCLPDAALDAVMYRLFNCGILPSPKLEREVVQGKWLEWQIAWQCFHKHSHLRQGGSNHGSNGSDGNVVGGTASSTALERITQTVVSLMADTPCSTANGGKSPGTTADTTTSLAQLSPEEVKKAEGTMTQTLSAWGGIAGIDGGGACGYGVLYCIDKAWWDAWSAYVGWTWLGDEPPSPTTTTIRNYVRPPRPGSLSTESLLDNGNHENVLRGTYGSYELMRYGIKRDQDYVLVPPGVWDVLLELYGGGPPLPRIVKPPERKFSDSNRLPTDVSNSRDNGSHHGSSAAGVSSSASAETEQSHLDHLVQGLDETTWHQQLQRVSRIPESFSVALHPWILHVHLCDPAQPYRRGSEVGPPSMPSIRIMSMPDQPLWRLFSEIVARFPLQGCYKAFAGSDELGKGRLWKKVPPQQQQSGQAQQAMKDPVSRYGPWNLLCKNRYAVLPDVSSDYSNKDNDINFATTNELIQNWKEYTDNSTVEGIGLQDCDHIMLEFAVMLSANTTSTGNNKSEGPEPVLVWPREAAAKAGHVRRLAEEDMKFRRVLLGLDTQTGQAMLKPPTLVGMEVDAMDCTGRWYNVMILEVDVVDDDETEEEDGDHYDDDDEIDDLAMSRRRSASNPSNMMSRKKVRVDFKDYGGHQEWIDVESDRIAVAGRFTSETVSNSGSPTSGTSGGNGAAGEQGNHYKTNNGSSSAAAAAAVSNEPGNNNAVGAPLKKEVGPLSGMAAATAATATAASENNGGSGGGKICLWPGYGACGLTNLGNTCYINSAVQCMSYLPLLRSYLISVQYKSTGDLNKDNPLGTGGKLLEEFAELLRQLWSGKTGEKSPTRFRSQLGKINGQFSGADQQDAQEFLNYILDMLHEDSNKVRKKPYVEALEDDWVTKQALPRVGDESWRRFLRRNRSVLTDVGMGQVVNIVTCPVCHYSSRNFDPFNLLSIPIPTIGTDVIFKCVVYRRSSALNCPWVLNKPRKGSSSGNSSSSSSSENRHSTRFTQPRKSPSSSGNFSPPSESNVAEEYVIAMSRLADSGDLRLQIQNACGIPASQLRICRAEELIAPSDHSSSNNKGNSKVISSQIKVTPLTDKEGPCSQLARKRSSSSSSSSPGSKNDDATSTPVTLIVAFESTIRPRLMQQQKETTNNNTSHNDDEPLEDTADEEEDEDENIDDDHTTLTPKEQQHVQRYLDVYGDGRECRLVDTNCLPIAKAVSRSLWPRNQYELKLGLRVDARDHRGNWFPGNVIEIITDNDDGGDGPATACDADTGEELSIVRQHQRKVRVHFDNFSSKWDELYSFQHFERGSVRPLYSHSSPRINKPTEFVVHNRYTDRMSGHTLLFGQSFYVQCQNEWSNARAGAHILAQASRYLRLPPPSSDSAAAVNRNNTANHDAAAAAASNWGSGDILLDNQAAMTSDREMKSRRLYEKTQSTISDLIDLLVDCDREYVRLALGVSEHSNMNSQQRGVGGRRQRQQHQDIVEPFRNPTFDPTPLSSLLVKKVSILLQRLPFEVRVCTVEATSGGGGEEIPFPFSLIRTIGNYMNARHAVVLQWREPPIDKKSGLSRSYLDAPVMYVEPKIEIDRKSAEILNSSNNDKKKAGTGNASSRRSSPKLGGGSGGIDLGVCLTEFCKVQNLTISDNWKCPHCKKFREGQQSMNIWRLPDLLTFHIKRFNMSARWREKITTKVNFPLTGLDMSEWCHRESPVTTTLEIGGSSNSSHDACIYDLIGVVNHYGSMTGGHYVATCKATRCSRDGKEEVCYNFNGVGANVVVDPTDIANGAGGESTTGGTTSWRLPAVGRQSQKAAAAAAAAASQQNKVVAAQRSSQIASESNEPLWLQFDDELVEPIPPRLVVSEMAYVLFYRRRQMTPSNIAKYSTLD